MLIAGGHIADFVGLAKTSIYNPATNSWTAVPDMNAGRWYPTLTTLPNGDVLVVSGQIDISVGVNPLPQVYQTATNTWRNLTGAQLNQALYPMMFLAPNGKVIDVGPTNVTRWLDTAGTGAWSSVAMRKFGWRDYGTAAMYADGKILVAGGARPADGHRGGHRPERGDAVVACRGAHEHSPGATSTARCCPTARCW